MNTRHNVKNLYVQTKCPVLDEDFDLFSPEVIDSVISQRSSKEDMPYMMSFKPQSEKTKTDKKILR